jgi:hypothetical protein
MQSLTRIYFWLPRDALESRSIIRLSSEIACETYLQPAVPGL